MEHVVFLFAHGAGAGSDSAWMKAWAKRLGKLGEVHAFDYPYMKKRQETGKRGPPDKPDKLLDCHEEALRSICGCKKKVKPNIFLIGKSMGSRMGCHLIADRQPKCQCVRGIICMGYPFQAPWGKRAVRSEVLESMREQSSIPTLFLSGDRDQFVKDADFEKFVREQVAETDFEGDDGIVRHIPGASTSSRGIRSFFAAGTKEEKKDVKNEEKGVVGSKRSRDAAVENVNTIVKKRRKDSICMPIFQLTWVKTGDHSLLVTKRFCKQAGQTQASINAAISDDIKRFVNDVLRHS